MVDLVCQTLSGLQSVHRAGIVHRDLKPDNIFVTGATGNNPLVKLLDFGVSKMLDQQPNVKLTATGVVIGTAFYLAPEQARGDRHLDHRVDIYAVGVILYEALTGRRPFEGDTYNEIIIKIATEPFPAPRKLNPTIPPAIERVILRAMSADPARRYASAHHMREALEQALVSGWESYTTSVVETAPNRHRRSDFRPTQVLRPIVAHRPRFTRPTIARGFAAAVFSLLCGLALLLNNGRAQLKATDSAAETAVEPPRDPPSLLALRIAVTPLSAADGCATKVRSSRARSDAHPARKRASPRRPKARPRPTATIKGRFGTVFITDRTALNNG